MSTVKFIDITRAKFDSLTPKDDASIYFVKETNNTYSLYKGSTLVSSNIKLDLSGGTMTGPITMGSNNITGNNSSIFQAGRIIATNSNTNDHGITSKGTRANMLYLMDGATGGLAASLLDVDVKNTTTPQKRIAKMGIFGSATSGTGGTPSANYLWLSAVEGNTYNVDATLKVDAQNRVGIAIAGSGRPTQALDVDGKIRMRTATVDSDGADTVVTKGYMLGKIVSDTNNYLSSVTGSGNGTVTFNRQGLLPLTWEANHDHNSLYNTKAEITSLLDGKQSTVNGGASTIVSTNLLPDKALISNSSGKVAVSAITSTELGYLDGVTSNIQTQLSGKVDKDGNKVLSTNDYTTTEKNKLAGIASGAEVNVQANWTETNSNSDAFIKNKPTITNNYLTNVTGSGNGTVTFTREGLLPFTWEATHSHDLDEIDDGTTYKRVTESEKNTWSGKQDALGYIPENSVYKRTSIRNLGANDINYVSELGVKTYVDDAVSNKVDKDGSKVLSTNDYTTTEKNKLAGIASGAEVNVQADWNVTNTSSDAFIKNKPTIPTDLNQLTNTPGFTSWNQVWSGSINLNSYTNGYYQVAVPSNSYIGKRIAIEVQYGSGTVYTSKIIFGVLGNSSTTTASTTISRGIGWNYFDGTYFRIKTLFAYTPTGLTTSIYVGNLKTLFGTFTGTTIEWSTSYSETLYMKKIWVIE